jgi:two-component system chemotaxis response regulator CheB
MQTRRIVVIGTSAGGIEALRDLAGALPNDFPAAIAVVMHTAPQSPGVLHDILSRSGALTAISPRGGERLRPGYIYVAPPDHHLLLEPGRAIVSRGPRENRFRPAIDPLFRSAAQVFGPLAIGVILTGNLDDGVAGLWSIKQLGGIAIVQDPAEALFPSMPEHALDAVRVDYVVKLAELGPLLVRLVTAPVAEPVAAPAAAAADAITHTEIEVKIAKEQDPFASGIGELGEPSRFACPECHGVLLQVKEAGRIRFRCHTGHAYSADSLLAEIDEQIEVALWNAIRAAQEGELLMREIARHLQAAHPNAPEIARLKERTEDLMRKTTAMREIVTSEPEPVTDKG